ncbi:MAG: hypothetical protein DMG34_07925 [Acidobacteria bacterium]|nr:MAG: hypothetical protein DMG34_07925 [Acidobacteriota bacterium]
MEEQQIEQNVVPLAGDGEAGNLMMRNQLREPGVIDVTAEVAGLDARVPKTRDQQENGNQNDSQAICSKEAATRSNGKFRRASVARLNGHSDGGSASILHG